MPTSGDYNYDVINVSQANITSYIGVATDVVIPSTLDGYTVTAIGANAFKSKSLTSVTIPDGVTSIGTDAFRYNSLTSITIPSSVTTMGQYAFATNSLAYLEINHDYSIGECAFSSNPFSTGVVVNADITSTVGLYLFRSCNLQDRLTFGATVTRIPNNIGFNAGLTSITIPNSVTSIGAGAFQDNSLTSITIPSLVTSIGASAFQSNSLTSITLPDSVTSVGTNAFRSNSISLLTVWNSATAFSTSISGVLYENPGGIIRGWSGSTAQTLADSYAHYTFDAIRVEANNVGLQVEVLLDPYIHLQSIALQVEVDFMSVVNSVAQSKMNIGMHIEI